MSIHSYLIGILCLAFGQKALAEVTHPQYPTTAVSSGNMVQITLSLLLVIAAIVLVAWLLKRMNIAQQGAGTHLKIISGVAIGQRERIVVIEVEDTWLVVGVGPGQIRTLHTLQKPAGEETTQPSTPPSIPFSAWLKRVIEKRNAT